MISETQKKELVVKALENRLKAYTPYSHHKVGAALLTGKGKLYLGCNIENAAYGPTNCAERTAFFKAVYEGEREFSAIAIVGGMEDVSELPICAPCGICRQVMMEFCDPKTFRVILGTNNPEKYEILTLEQLLPLGFGPAALG